MLPKASCPGLAKPLRKRDVYWFSAADIQSAGWGFLQKCPQWRKCWVADVAQMWPKRGWGCLGSMLEMQLIGDKKRWGWTDEASKIITCRSRRRTFVGGRYQIRGVMR
jgi:hypothetical protein